MRQKEIEAKLFVPIPQAKSSNQLPSKTKDNPQSRKSEVFKKPSLRSTDMPDIESLKAIPQSIGLEGKPCPKPLDIGPRNSNALVKGKNGLEIQEISKTEQSKPKNDGNKNNGRENSPISSLIQNKTSDIIKEMGSRPSFQERLQLNRQGQAAEVEARPRLERSTSSSALKGPKVPLIKSKPAKLMLSKSKVLGLALKNLNYLLLLSIKGRIFLSWSCLKSPFIIKAFLQKRISRKRRRKLLVKAFSGLKNIRGLIKKAAQQNYTFVKPLKPVSQATQPIKASNEQRLSINPRASSRTPSVKRQPAKKQSLVIKALEIEEPQQNTFKPPIPIPKELVPSIPISSESKEEISKIQGKFSPIDSQKSIEIFNKFVTAKAKKWD